MINRRILILFSTNMAVFVVLGFLWWQAPSFGDGRGQVVNGRAPNSLNPLAETDESLT